MAEKLITSLTLLTAAALVVYNGRDVSQVISSIAGGANAVISTLLTRR